MRKLSVLILERFVVSSVFGFIELIDVAVLVFEKERERLCYLLVSCLGL